MGGAPGVERPLPCSWQVAEPRAAPGMLPSSGPLGSVDLWVGSVISASLREPVGCVHGDHVPMQGRQLLLDSLGESPSPSFSAGLKPGRETEYAEAWA